MKKFKWDFENIKKFKENFNERLRNKIGSIINLNIFLIFKNFINFFFFQKVVIFILLIFYSLENINTLDGNLYND